MSYNGILRKVIKNRNGENAGFVIQTKGNQVIQYTKEEVKQKLAGGFKVAGLTLASDNSLHVNKKKLEEVKADLIEVTPENLSYTRNEASRYITDTIIKKKYKGYKDSSEDALNKSKSLYIVISRKYMEVIFTIRENTGINLNIGEDAVVAKFVEKYHDLIPLIYENEISIKVGMFYPNLTNGRNMIEVATDENGNIIQVDYMLGILVASTDRLTVNEVQRIIKALL